MMRIWNSDGDAIGDIATGGEPPVAAVALVWRVATAIDNS